LYKLASASEARKLATLPIVSHNFLKVPPTYKLAGFDLTTLINIPPISLVPCGDVTTRPCRHGQVAIFFMKTAEVLVAWSSGIVSDYGVMGREIESRQRLKRIYFLND
jgi:hypothetical protein